MELIEKTIKIYTLELTKNEVVDLRNILHNYLKEDSIDGWQRVTVDKLKKELDEV